MATLVLTAVGTAIGGPVGGAIGALLGGAVDRQLFGSGRREGPRLSDLKVQTSSYGAAIPEVFGTMRVAGTVIWATELQEHRATGRSSKAGPAVTSYSYSASFAVLLSARRIAGIGRIWADGKLLRGAAGDLKVAGAMRWYPGDEAQAADPLIASSEGIVLAPACRGQAYVVFEDLALADFGNRIPSLTFEVIADEVAVSTGEIVASVARDAIVVGEATPVIGGFSAYGRSARDVVDGLAELTGAWFAEAGERLVMRCGVGSGVVPVVEDAGAGGHGCAVRSMAPADGVPRSLTLAYYDPARDYQAGVQRADRPGPGTRTTRIDLPAVIEAGAAKTMAVRALARSDAERERRTVALDWRRIDIAPGDRVTIAGEGGVWRVAGWSLEGMALTLELRRLGFATLPAVATPGRVRPAPDAQAGTTVVHAFECPSFDDRVLDAPRLIVAAAGTGAGWRRASLQLSGDGVAWTPVGSTALPAVLGWVVVPPGAAGSQLVDRRHSIEVELANAAMALFDADEGALDRGANLAIVGEELLQFGRAERIAGVRWRLSELWRGRRGTEWAAGAAVAGDRFVLIEAGSFIEVPLPVGVVGSTVQVIASGVATADTPVTSSAMVSGASVVPPTPIGLVAKSDGAMLSISWTRRSRAGWRWNDGIDVPIAEEAEHYRVGILDALGEMIADHEAAAPALIVPLPDGADRVSVRMTGTFGASRAATVSIN